MFNVSPERLMVNSSCRQQPGNGVQEPGIPFISSRIYFLSKENQIYGIFSVLRENSCTFVYHQKYFSCLLCVVK